MSEDHSHEFCYDPDCYHNSPMYITPKSRTRRYGRGEHVMNKNEASVMRRLQSETGLTEEQIREHKKYRVILSEAQTLEGPGQTDGQRVAKRLLKHVTRELKLAKEHPDVIAAAMKVAEEYNCLGNRYLPFPLTHYMSKLLQC